MFHLADVWNAGLSQSLALGFVLCGNCKSIKWVLIDNIMTIFKIIQFPHIFCRILTQGVDKMFFDGELLGSSKYLPVLLQSLYHVLSVEIGIDQNDSV